MIGDMLAVKADERLARYTGLLVAVPAGFYALMVANGWLQYPSSYSKPALVSISMSLVGLGLVQFFQRSQSSFAFGLYLTFYHLLLALMFAYVTGFVAPVVVLWMVLAFMSAIYFGQVAFYASVAGLATAALYATSISAELSYKQLTFSMITTAFVAVTGYVMSRGVINESVRAQDTLERTKQRDETERERFTTLINSVGEAIVSINTRGVVQIYNAATLNLLDTNQSIAGKKFDDIFQLYEGDHPLTLVDYLIREKRSVVRDDLSHVYDDDESIKLYVSASPIRGYTPSGRERLEGFILVMRDITKEKSLEEERDEFISVISHELRTPITIAEGSLSNLKLLYERGLPKEKMQAPVESAHDQIVYLANMVNDLGTLSRAERGVGDATEEIDVNELLHELYDQYHPKAETKELALDLDIAPSVGNVRASRLYLEEMLQNFLTNAIKYTPSGTVTLGAQKKDGGVYFYVSDTGIGITKSDQNKVFDKFYRSEDYRTRETSGTGLGLYVVRKLASKLGTHIDLQSRLNHGSTFGFLLKSPKQ